MQIDSSLCNGCGRVKEPRCVTVCPGNLLFKGHGDKCVIRDAGDCWDCAACVKECPRQAIKMFLPVQIGGRGSTLQAKKERSRITWQLTKPDGSKETYVINTGNG